MSDQGNGCFLGDPVDGTFFAEDVGGEAVKDALDADGWGTDAITSRVGRC